MSNTDKPEKKPFSPFDMVRILLAIVLIVVLAVYMMFKDQPPEGENGNDPAVATQKDDNPGVWSKFLSMIGFNSVDASNEITVLKREGGTMGTRYLVQTGEKISEKDWDHISDDAVEAIKTIDRLMSTYNPDSELSKFNASTSTDWFEVSRKTAEVVKIAQDVSIMTNGAFDVTVGPLVNRWQFGPEKSTNAPLPDAEEIAQLLKKTGYKKLEYRLDPPALKKSIPELYVDLSGIAKGFAADEGAKALIGQKTTINDKKDQEITGVLVEVGGETYAAGRKGPNKSWMLGIAYPEHFSTDAYLSFPLEDRALATSGGYENFREAHNMRFSHIIDPRTGEPTEKYPIGALPPKERLVSVSVIDKTCARADALATALFVLGQKDGLALAEREELSVLFLVRDSSGKIHEIASRAFEKYREPR